MCSTSGVWLGTSSSTSTVRFSISSLNNALAVLLSYRISPSHGNALQFFAANIVLCLGYVVRKVKHDTADISDAERRLDEVSLEIFTLRRIDRLEIVRDEIGVMVVKVFLVP